MELKIDLDDNLDIDITQETDEMATISLESDENQVIFVITNDNLISFMKEVKAYMKKHDLINEWA